VPNVCAVIVTHNREPLLRECLSALGAQSRRPDRIVVVDNASTDGSADMVQREFPSVHVLALPENQQCAGGFNEGLRAAHAGGADWIWLLDDDCHPMPTALEELLRGTHVRAPLPPPALVVGRVIWNDGRLHPMNVPGFERGRVERVIEAGDQALLPIRSASFPSLMVSRGAIDRYGLPHKHYVIYGDDIEWSARILHHEPGYLVPRSIAHHKTKAPHTATESGPRFYYHVRNALFMLRGAAWDPAEKLSLAWMLLTTSLAYARRGPSPWANGLVVLRGLRDGLRPGAEV
jgi:rhamnopyranosyl-N-acetylglucosaminyl-diphospho-decaprenol beta-1,3/1,4-galactofuranosyltransferase